VVSGGGYGSAHNGLGEWYWQRLSAVALAILLPLPLLLLIGVYTGNISQSGLLELLDHFFSRLLHTVLVLALLIHAFMGLKVIIEDYVHSAGFRIPLTGAMLTAMTGVGIWWLSIVWAW